MKIIKSLHTTATDRKLLLELEKRIKDGDIEDVGESVFTKRIKMTITEIEQPNIVHISRQQRTRDDFGRTKFDYSKIIIEVDL